MERGHDLYSVAKSIPDTTTSPDKTDQRLVELRLGNLFPVLSDASIDRKQWLADFENETICVSSDLYEVIQAYETFFAKN